MKEPRTEAERPVQPTAEAVPPGYGRRIDSTTLFAGSREIVIDHGDAAYRLRITGQGKLILTK